MIFESHYSIGDRVKIRKGEHNDNWAGKFGKIVEIGIDGTEKSHKIIYSVKYFNDKGETIEAIPCFRESDLELIK